MLNLDPNEEVLKIMHHHWIFILGPAFFLFIIMIAPFGLLPFIAAAENTDFGLPLFLFFDALWFLLIFLLGFTVWMKYYLDALIITNRRIMDVKQEGLFKHSVSEFRLDRVQDITIEIPNFAATIFHYGNITLETASEENFLIKEVPYPHIARDLILKYSKRNGGGGV